MSHDTFSSLNDTGLRFYGVSVSDTIAVPTAAVVKSMFVSDEQQHLFQQIFR